MSALEPGDYFEQWCPTCDEVLEHQVSTIPAEAACIKCGELNDVEAAP